MKDKRGLPTKKDDDNPFAGYLYEDEKILWMDGALKTTRPNDRKTFAYISLAALIIWILLVSQFRDMSVAISTSGLRSCRIDMMNSFMSCPCEPPCPPGFTPGGSGGRFRSGRFFSSP